MELECLCKRKTPSEQTSFSRQNTCKRTFHISEDNPYGVYSSEEWSCTCKEKGNIFIKGFKFVFSLLFIPVIRLFIGN